MMKLFGKSTCTFFAVAQLVQVVQGEQCEVQLQGEQREVVRAPAVTKQPVQKETSAVLTEEAATVASSPSSESSVSESSESSSESQSEKKPYSWEEALARQQPNSWGQNYEKTKTPSMLRLTAEEYSEYFGEKDDLVKKDDLPKKVTEQYSEYQKGMSETSASYLGGLVGTIAWTTFGISAADDYLLFLVGLLLSWFVFQQIAVQVWHCYPEKKNKTGKEKVYGKKQVRCNIQRILINKVVERLSCGEKMKLLCRCGKKETQENEDLEKQQKEKLNSIPEDEQEKKNYDTIPQDEEEQKNYSYDTIQRVL